MCLLQAIINSNSKVIELNSTAIANYGQEEMANEIQKNSANIQISKNEIAKMYKQWIDSKPFDIGNNTRATMGSLAKEKIDDPNLAKICIEITKKQTKSLSNGSMMRVAPLAVWAANIQDIDILSSIISTDVGFTHGNETVHQAVLVYSAAIGSLLRNLESQNRAVEAFEFAKQIAIDRKFETCLEWLDLAQKLYECVDFVKM